MDEQKHIHIFLQNTLSAHVGLLHNSVKLKVCLTFYSNVMARFSL